MKPSFSVTVDGRQDATDAIAEHLLLLAVTDEAGWQADAVEIRLNDRGAVPLPRRGAAEIQVSLGFEGRPETVAGRYTVDEIELSAPPAVRGKGVDMRTGMKPQKTRPWDDVSLGDLVPAIAADHGLAPRVGRSLRGLRISHLDQTDESDLHLLTRLARENDAIAKPAARLFVPQGVSESSTGQLIPSLRVAPGDTAQWRVTLADREEYRSARAHWRTAGAGIRMTETAGEGEPAYTLRELYPRAALQRAGRRLNVTLQPGNPEVAVEGRLDLQGFRAGVDGAWICERVRHRLDRGGCKITAEATLEAA